MKYGLIGEKLGHSFSKKIHGLFDISDYELLEIKKDALNEFLTSGNFCGLNVTIPYKQSVIPYVHTDDIAGSIGSVNTIVLQDGQLFGYNTDYYGFIYMVKRAGIKVAGKKVVILGSGGTSRTAVYAMAALGAKAIVVVSRSKTSFSMDVKADTEFITYSDTEHFEDADVLVNTTPVGMYPNNEECPVDLSIFYQLKGVVDVIYNPLKTKLTQEASRRKIRCTNGLPMLVAQAWYAQRFFLHEEVMLTKEGEQQVEAVLNKIRLEEQNLVLIGMPGVGKTTLGKALAKKLGREFVDTDELFYQQYQKSAGAYILENGEEEFRRRESQIVQETAKKTGVVIATGGGSILLEKNRQWLQQNGYMIFMQQENGKLATVGRPLSQGTEELKALYYERLPIYLGLAGVTVSVKSQPEDTLQEVMCMLEGGSQKKYRVLVINGPNINMLGIREPDIYGHQTYADLIRLLKKESEKRDVSVEFFQSNQEGDLVEAIQNAYGRMDGIIINPAAYTHTSVALADAIKAVSIPTVEVHISEVDKREEFRSISYVRNVCIAMISGEGLQGYVSALDRLLEDGLTLMEN